jgi:multiple sugar transport system permease protein
MSTALADRARTGRSASAPRAIARRALARVLTHLLMIALSVVMVVPFISMATTSLMTMSQAYSFPPAIWPDPFVWANYPEALALQPFGRYFLNSGILALGVTAGRVINGALAAYAFSRLVFPGRDLIFFAYLGTMMIPEHVTLIPLFLILNFFGWLDSYQGLILPFAVTAFGVFLLRQFFITIPRELEEAAVIDGCGAFGVFWRIILPLAKPGLASLAILSFVSGWNMFVWPLIVANSANMRTIVIGIAQFQAAYGAITNWPYVMAISTLAVIPTLFIFFVGQRYFVQGITLSGLKG